MSLVVAIVFLFSDGLDGGVGAVGLYLSCCVSGRIGSSSISSAGVVVLSDLCLFVLSLFSQFLHWQ